VRFAPHTEDDISEMLATLGLSSVDDLFADIPRDVRLDRPLDIPAGVSEMELIADMRALASRNLSTDQLVCFAGGGAYDHYIPSVVWALAGRSEFYTSYTPYQPELSQGVLQTLFEFQSMICELTGLEVSNASLYDGATALVEAVNMARGHGRDRILVSSAVDPRLVDTLLAYGRGAGYEPEVFAAADGRGGAPEVGPDVAAVIVQHPNVYGILEPVRDLFGMTHDGGARAIQVFDPLSLGVLAPPGELGADIAVAEGQPLGNHLNYGGPYLGLIAARLDDVRKMPGRIVGETVDVDGKTGYVLTLQAREQHIRREKANSNICTNQTLMAVAATIYLGWLGPAGLAELGRQCASKAAYAAERLTQIDGVDLLYPGAAFFKEFALAVPRQATEVRDALIDRGFLAGVPLADADGHALAVAVTEKRSRDEIDRFAQAFAEVLA
jgi:glycine dehydrogenase subunit 1